MLFSRGAEYGIRATLYLVANHNGGFRPINEISDKLDISFHFLTKVFQKLTKAGLLQSFRGPKGGVSLLRPASEFTLEDVVLAIDGDDIFTTCVLGLPGCGDCKPCPLHDEWAAQRSNIQEMLSRTTLETAAMEIHSEKLRLEGGFPCP